MQAIERWDSVEFSFNGPTDGNPFSDVTFHADFSNGEHKCTVRGFYDGDGIYRIRFMPDTPGEWTYVTKSNVAALDGQSGSFTCTPAGAGNHGPVHVHNQFHFAYADGTPFYSFGTTCYAWTHQGDALEEQTLETLRESMRRIRPTVFISIPKKWIQPWEEIGRLPHASISDLDDALAAAEKGWIDEHAIVLVNWHAFRRAGADILITYHGRQALKEGWL